MSLNPTRSLLRQRAPGGYGKIFGTKSVCSNVDSQENGGGHKMKYRMPLIPLLQINRLFHHQTTITRLHIQISHGILFEALQKSEYYSKSDIQDIKIPEELRRLKAGSLKWLFQFWPSKTILKASYHNEKGRKAAVGNFSNDQKQEESSEQFRKSKEENQKQLHDMVEYLKRKEIAIRRLLKLPWLLNSDPEVVEAAAKHVQQILGLKDFKIAISFVDTGIDKLNETAKIWKEEHPELLKLAKEAQDDCNESLIFETRIDYLAHHLKCSKEDVSDMMAKVKYLMVLPLNKIDTVLKSLLEGGVSTEGVLTDPWVFIHNLKKMEARLCILEANGITDFKPWILRTPKPSFDKFVVKQKEELELLGGSKDLQGFLQNKLNCDEEAVSRIFYKVPSIKNASVFKINEMITFLYSSGFSAKHILDTPRILGHSVDTISQRLEEFKAISSTPIEDLHILCRTAKDYKQALVKIKKGTERKPVRRGRSMKSNET